MWVTLFSLDVIIYKLCKRRVNVKVLKIIGFITLGLIVITIGAYFAFQYYVKKEDPNYVLEYIKEHEDEKTASLIVRKNGEILYAVNGNEKLPLASMAKIVIAVEFAKQVSEGKLQREEQIPLAELEKYYVENTDGGAHPAWLEHIKENELVQNEQVSLDEVARGMIHFSSNANTTYLQERLGIDRVNESLQELGLKNHEPFYPLTASLYMRGYVEKELRINEEKSLQILRDMPMEEYRKHVSQIHEWMKDEEEWKQRNISLKMDMDFQRIWSDRLVAAAANDYVKLLDQMNNRTAFSREMYDEIDNIFEGTISSEKYEYGGQKGGSTAFVLTNSVYLTDKDGNKFEMVFMSNDLGFIQAQKLRNNLHLFLKEVITNKEFLNKL